MGKEEVKMSLVTDSMTLYVENPMAVFQKGYWS